MANSSATPTETILVVDDDPEVLSVAEDMLRSMGYTVTSTLDPRVALRFARTHPGEIHLLLTDVVMPLMGGGQLAEEVRALRPDVKVLFMSAYWESLEDYGIRLAPGAIPGQTLHDRRTQGQRPGGIDIPHAIVGPPCPVNPTHVGR
jgi:CheY-like chemotaxis protein